MESLQASKLTTTSSQRTFSCNVVASAGPHMEHLEHKKKDEKSFPRGVCFLVRRKAAAGDHLVAPRSASHPIPKNIFNVARSGRKT